MRNIKYTIYTLLCGLVFGVSLTYAMDKSFIIEYAQAYGYDSEFIHTANSEEECDEDTFFDNEYGLCVPIMYTKTDTDVGL